MRIQSPLLRSAFALVLFLLGTAAARADFIVTPTVTFSGGLYHYDYTVTNTDAAAGVELLLVDILVPDTDAAVLNLMSPSSDFVVFTDPTLQFVSFLENTIFAFGATPVSGFTFDSPFGPAPTTFGATFLDAAGDLRESSGVTVGPNASVVPGPGAIVLLASGLPALLLFGRRRR